MPTNVALYVPGRALNSMYLIGIDNCRLIDDNTELSGKYLPYFINPIETFDSIVKNPPKAILIFSRTFGTLIKEKCQSINGVEEVFTLDDL